MTRTLRWVARLIFMLPSAIQLFSLSTVWLVSSDLPAQCASPPTHSLSSMLPPLPPQLMYEKIMTAELRFPRHFLPETRSLLAGMLTRNVEQRLGYAGTDEVGGRAGGRDIAWLRAFSCDGCYLSSRCEHTPQPLFPIISVPTPDVCSIFRRSRPTPSLSASTGTTCTRGATDQNSSRRPTG